MTNNKPRNLALVEKHEKGFWMINYWFGIEDTHWDAEDFGPPEGFWCGSVGATRQETVKQFKEVATQRQQDFVFYEMECSYCGVIEEPPDDHRCEDVVEEYGDEDNGEFLYWSEIDNV